LASHEPRDSIVERIPRPVEPGISLSRVRGLRNKAPCMLLRFCPRLAFHPSLSKTNLQCHKRLARLRRRHQTHDPSALPARRKVEVSLSETAFRNVVRANLERTLRP